MPGQFLHIPYLCFQNSTFILTLGNIFSKRYMPIKDKELPQITNWGDFRLPLTSSPHHEVVKIALPEPKPQDIITSIMLYSAIERLRPSVKDVLGKNKHMTAIFTGLSDAFDSLEDEEYGNREENIRNALVNGAKILLDTPPTPQAVDVENIGMQFIRWLVTRNEPLFMDVLERYVTTAKPSRSIDMREPAELLKQLQGNIQVFP